MADRWRDAYLARFDPFRGLAEIQKDLSRAFDRYFDDPGRATERTWAPPLDVYETKDDLVMTVELPGVKEKDVRLSIVGEVLSLRGQRVPNSEVREENYHRIERWSGSFERHIQLPISVQADKVRATYRDGVLEIRLPKVEEVKPREIKIEVG